MSEEMNGKSFSISWLFWPGLILIFIALISILTWNPPEDSKGNINSRVLQDDPQKNTKTRILREYTPPPTPPKKPIYRPLPKKPKTKSNLQPLPKDNKPKVKSNLHPLPDIKPKTPKPNYQPLKEVGK